jgi:hypothetical protein
VLAEQVRLGHLVALHLRIEGRLVAIQYLQQSLQLAVEVARPAMEQQRQAAQEAVLVTQMALPVQQGKVTLAVLQLAAEVGPLAVAEAVLVQ